MILPIVLSLVLVVVPSATLLYVLLRERRRRLLALAAHTKLGPLLLLSETNDDDALLAKLAELAPVTQVQFLRTFAEQKDGLLRARALVLRLPAAEFLRVEVRSAKTWPERTAAATVIGQLRVTTAIDALLSALRDPYEDQSSVKVAAAEALAAFKDGEALPILLEELRRADDDASPLIADALAGFGELAIAGLIEVLRARDGKAGRVWAARILGRLKAREAIPALLERFSDRDEKIRLAVATAFGEIGERSTLQSLVAALLRDPAAQVRAEAAVSVGKVAGEGAIEILVSTLSDPDYATRLRALEALEQFRGTDPSPILRALSDPSPEVRKRAALALDRIGYVEQRIQHLAIEPLHPDSANLAFLRSLASAGVLQTLASYTIHPSSRIRAYLAELLGAFGTDAQASELVRLLEDSDWIVRAAAAEALGTLRASSAHEALARALSDVRHEVQEEAARAMSSCDAKVLPAHRAAIESVVAGGTTFARQEAVLLLARFPDDESTPAIVDATRDPSVAVRRTAVTALARPRMDAVRIPALVERLQDQEPEVRLAAASALGTAATHEAFEGLLRSLPGATPNLRERITESLASGPRAYVLSRVTELLESSDVDVKLGIVWTLGKLADGADILASLLRGGDPKVRASAAGALGKIPGEVSLEALVRASTDPDGRVRAASVGSLMRIGIGVSRAAMAIVTRLRDPDPFIRNRAVVALSRIDAEKAKKLLEAPWLQVSEPARLVAETFAGERKRVMFAILEPGKLDDIRAFLRTESPVLETAFNESIGLPSALQNASGAALALREVYEDHARRHLEPERRADALFALLQYTDVRATALFSEVLGADPALEVRAVAAKAMMGRTLDTIARAALVRAASDPCPEVAIPSVQALSREGPGADPRERSGVMNSLIRRLGASSPEVNQAIEASLAIFARGAIDEFVDQALAVPSIEVRVSAFRVMAEVGPVQCAPLLMQAARGHDVQVRTGAIAALARIPTREARESIRVALADPAAPVRLAAISGLVQHKATLEEIGLVARDPAPEVRQAFASLLSMVSGSSKVLDTLMRDPDATVRGRALGSLMLSDATNLRPMLSQVTPEMRTALSEDPRRDTILKKLRRDAQAHIDPRERATAVQALAAFQISDRAQVLITALRDPSAEVRLAALKVSGDADTPEWLAALRDCLADADARVRTAAQEVFELITNDAR
jgi:HEAT repeat protein